MAGRMLIKGGASSPLGPPTSTACRRRRFRGGGAAPHATRRRQGRAVLLVVVSVVFVVGSLALASPVATGGLDVVEIDGPVDAVQRDFLRAAVVRAESEGAEALMLRVNSPGSLGVPSAELMATVRRSRVPVVVYVGPAGAVARGAGAFLAAAAGLVVVAPGAEIGPLLPDDLDRASLTAAEARDLLHRQASRPEVAAAYERVLRRPLSGGEALRGGLATFAAPTVGDAVVGLDGRSVVAAGGRVVTLETAEVRRVDTPEGKRRRRVPSVSVRFDKLTGAKGFFHKIDTPTYAYVLLALGLLALAFEFFAASVGIAGVVGAALVLLSFQAMGTLPVRWWAVALVCLGVVTFCADVSLARLGALTVCGTACVLAGSVWFTDVGVYRVHWYAVVLVTTGVVAFFAFAMTSVSRNRFATPTIGREVLVGRRGVARSPLAPDGLVAVDGAVWSARSHRGRIGEGRLVTVRAVEGFVLEVDAAAAETPV